MRGTVSAQPYCGTVRVSITVDLGKRDFREACEGISGDGAAPSLQDCERLAEQVADLLDGADVSQDFPDVEDTMRRAVRTVCERFVADRGDGGAR